MCAQSPMNDAQPGTPKATPQERRGFIRMRKEVRLSCHLMEDYGRPVDISTRNVSVEGLLITLRREVKIGAMLTLRATMDDGRVEVVVPGRVAWADYNGVTGHFEAGVSLVGIDPTRRKNILSLLGTSLGNEGIERRHYIRLPRRLMVEHRLARGILRRWKSGHTKDISVGGVGVIATEEIKAHTEINLRIHLDSKSGRPIHADGIVVDTRKHPEPSGGVLLAVKFTRQEPDSRQRLGEYITGMLNAEVILPGRGVRIWKGHAKKQNKEGAGSA